LKSGVDNRSMKFQFSIARLLLATAGFAFVLGIMKPLKLAGHPLVLIAASAVAWIVLIANKDQFRFKGTIAIGLQIINVSLIIALIYLNSFWGEPVRWNAPHKLLEVIIEQMMLILLFPLGYLCLGSDFGLISALFLVLNCYLWAHCICWIIALFKNYKKYKI
jgi:hypothetical protein